MPKPTGQFTNVPALCGLLMLAVLILYWPATGFEFSQYDDGDYFALNPQVQGGLDGPDIAWAFTTGKTSNWHPLTWLSLMMDADLGDAHSPYQPHLTNLILHAADSALLFLLLYYLTGARWRSLIVAGLFAVHPLNVESVAWVAERKNVLSTFFWFLSTLAYVRYVRDHPNTIWQNRFYIAALVLFALGLMSKAMLVTLPFTLLLLDYWPLGRISGPVLKWETWKKLVCEKIPFFVVSLLDCIITYLVQDHTKAVQTLARFPLDVRLENAVVAYARYLGKTFYPAGLAVDYPHPGHWPVSLVISAALVLVAASCLVVWGARNRWLPVGWCWFLGTLVPVIGLVQVGSQSLADRYAYIPLIGIFIIMAWGAAEVFERFKLPPAAIGAVAAMVLAASALVTRHQLGFWQNDGALFGHALEVTSGNAHAHATYGVYLEKSGDKSGALKHYQAAEAFDPTIPSVHFNLGNLLDDSGKTDDAIAEYHLAIRLDPGLYPAHYNLGLLLKRLGRNDEAIAEFRATLKDKPDLDSAKEQLQSLGATY